MEERLPGTEFPRITSIFEISAYELTKISWSREFPRWVTILPLSRLVYYLGLIFAFSCGLG